jgi:drug/metabolite transporter (DMT)-like permease
LDNNDRAAEATKGLLWGIGANFIWGLAFLVPTLLPHVSPAGITAGRYLVYGMVSVVLFIAGTRPKTASLAMWKHALLFGFAGNIGYYFFVVEGIRLAGAPIVTVIIGTLPVTVAMYGNWLHREHSFRRLALPLVLILAGLLVVNTSEFRWHSQSGYSLHSQILGVCCAIVALMLWTWYGVANATFLKTHREITSTQWATMIGVTTMVLAVAASPLFAVELWGELVKSSRGSILMLVSGSVVLGVLVSWVGTIFWNRASSILPVSLTGQLIVFETISGLMYVFVAYRRVPGFVELLGIAILVVGILFGIRTVASSQ